MIESGDRVLALVRWKGHGKGSGVEMDSRGAHLWTFRTVSSCASTSTAIATRPERPLELGGNGVALVVMEEKDAVIVGARCAGSTLAIALAQRGWDVVVVDRDTFPSDTISTHMMFPNTLARFEQLGVLDTLRADHRLPSLGWRVVGLGHETAGTFTPIEGFDRGLVGSPNHAGQGDRRHGARGGSRGPLRRAGGRPDRLGTEEDPVGGVVLENGDEIRAKWVFGADGRGSTVAGELGIEKERQQQGEIAFMWAYWSGIPDDGFGTTDIQEDAILIRWALEDGLTMLVSSGPTSSPMARRTSGFATTSRSYRVPRLAAARASRGGRDGLRPGRRTRVADARVLPQADAAPAGRCWATPATSSTRAPRRGSATRSSRRSTSPSSSPAPTRPRGIRGLARERANEHYDWSFSWGASPAPRSRRSSSAAGRASPTPARTCATRTAAWSRPRR